ncbi:MAG: DUF3575 domain-containing protein [Alistipes sp.]|nr:DUF3575 domain-containing protein [Alistipes sp.]
MKRLILTLAALFVFLSATAQDDVAVKERFAPAVKLNAAYALVGIINPQVEFRFTPHSAFQAELVYSPWQSVKGHPLHFGMFINEYRYYIAPRHTRGLYVGANVGMMGFNMSKPMFVDGGVKLQDRYCKGYGFMLGGVVGYQWLFAERWMLDVFVGFSYMYTMYNGYSMDGVIDMHPNRPAWKEPASPDPFNISAEWLPNKAGISIGFLLWK